MQGTMVVLMALSGLGCHHKHCEVAYAPACYSSCYDGGWGGCHGASYVSGCYSAPVVVESCYSAGYGGGCYSSGHGGKHGGGGFLGRLFGHKKNRGGCHDVVYSACYDAGYSSGYSACYSSGYSLG